MVAFATCQHWHGRVQLVSGLLEPQSSSHGLAVRIIQSPEPEYELLIEVESLDQAATPYAVLVPW